jgi:hypothetical protein
MEFKEIKLVLDKGITVIQCIHFDFWTWLKYYEVLIIQQGLKAEEKRSDLNRNYFLNQP